MNKNNRLIAFIAMIFILPMLGYWAAKIEFRNHYESDFSQRINPFLEFERMEISGQIVFQETINGRKTYALFIENQAFEYCYQEEIINYLTTGEMP